MPIYRPSKNYKINNEESIQKIEQLLEQGRHIETVCELVGTSRTAFYACINEWEVHGNEDFKEFAQRIKAARARFQERAEEALNQIALEEKDSRALMYLLTKRFPKYWGDKVSDRKAETAITNLLSIIKSTISEKDYEKILESLQEIDLEDSD
jgi:hypothetical protein